MKNVMKTACKTSLGISFNILYWRRFPGISSTLDTFVQRRKNKHMKIENNLLIWHLPCGMRSLRCEKKLIGNEMQCVFTFLFHVVLQGFQGWIHFFENFFRHLKCHVYNEQKIAKKFNIKRKKCDSIVSRICNRKKKLNDSSSRNIVNKLVADSKPLASTCRLPSSDQ